MVARLKLEGIDGKNGKLGTTFEGFSTIQQVRIGETCM